MTEETLRALIRLIQPVRQLRKDVESQMYLSYEGTGDLLVRTYNALHEAVMEIVDDNYLRALTLDVAHDTNDKQKSSMVLVATGQLLAFLQSQTGVPGAESGNTQIQTAPQVVISGNKGGDDLMDLAKKALGEEDDA